MVPVVPVAVADAGVLVDKIGVVSFGDVSPAYPLRQWAAVVGVATRAVKVSSVPPARATTVPPPDALTVTTPVELLMIKKR